MICNTGDFCGNITVPMSMTNYGLKDLLTVDLFSVYLLSRVDFVICYNISRYILRFGYQIMFVISKFYSIHFTVILAGT